MTQAIRYDAVSLADHDSLDVESQRALDALVTTWQRRDTELRAWPDGTAAYDSFMADDQPECLGHDSAGEPDQGYGYPRTVYCDGSCRR